ncbi:hypothetical protein [Streptomyces ureilyticus]|uniref:hypothetical protein n=1 Tax=Streptomyces ureilyticus TaxID=1775131 RepID=UPI0019D1DA2F|nr:hypothetical protein [Streptomyces ureilyticus]
MPDAPIYDQLISERGDIPLQVRSEARRLQSELGWIAEAEPSPAGRPPRSPTAPAPVPAPNSRPQPPGSQSGQGAGSQPGSQPGPGSGSQSGSQPDSQQGWFA